MSYTIEVIDGAGAWAKAPAEPDTIKDGIARVRAIRDYERRRARLVGLFGAAIFDSAYDAERPVGRGK